MTYPVTVFRWDDPGAPSLGTATGVIANDIKALLTACLVTGYGSKAPLGWTKEFDDANGVVYKNNVAGGGSGGMVRFWPTNGNWSAAVTSNAANYMRWQPAAQYTSSNAGSNVGQLGMFYHCETTATAKAWVLIGTAIGFYLFFHRYDASQTNSNDEYKIVNTTRYVPSMYIGDIIPTLVGDAGRFTTVWSIRALNDTTAVSYSDTLDSIGQLLTASPTRTHAWLYDTDGDINVESCTLCYPFHMYSGLNTAVPAGNFDPLFLAPAFLQRGAIYSSTAGVINQTGKQPTIRGIMPGLFASVLGDGGTSTYWPYTRTINGQQHYLIGTTQGNYQSNKWINMVEW